MLFDEKTQMEGTENCWLGREAAAMGPEPWRCTSLKSVWQHHTYSPSLWHTHHTSTHGGVWLWICWVFFFLTSLKQQKRSNVRALEAMHSCVTNKQHCNSDRARFIHCVILILLLRYTVIAWSIPFETFSMGFVCLFVLQGSCFLTCMRRRVTNEWFTLDCFPAVQCVNGSFSFITFVWKEKYFSLAFCMELISLAFNYFTNSNELIHNNHLILIY